MSFYFRYIYDDILNFIKFKRVFIDFNKIKNIIIKSNK
jgi:hypothetical protein